MSGHFRAAILRQAIVDVGEVYAHMVERPSRLSNPVQHDHDDIPNHYNNDSRSTDRSEHGGSVEPVVVEPKQSTGPSPYCSRIKEE